MQNEEPEAMQIEAQALVSDRVNQDPSDTHLPATAWPRQMLAVVYVTQHPLPMGVGRGGCGQPSTGLPSTGSPSTGRMVRYEYELMSPDRSEL